MLTKWAKSVLPINIVSGSNIGTVPSLVTSGSNKQTAVTPAKSASGNDFYITNYADSQNTNVIAAAVTDTTSNNSGFAIGSSADAESENDYNLKSPITSGFSGSVSASNVYDSENNIMKMRYIVTITNTGSESLEIKEIARFLGYNTATTLGAAASGNKKTFMIDRTVLDNPVTIAAGTSGVIHYDFIEFEPET